MKVFIIVSTLLVLSVPSFAYDPGRGHTPPGLQCIEEESKLLCLKNQARAQFAEDRDRQAMHERFFLASLEERHLMIVEKVNEHFRLCGLETRLSEDEVNCIEEKLQQMPQNRPTSFGGGQPPFFNH